MKRQVERIGGLAEAMSGDEGSILMEYVVVLVFFGAVLMMATTRLVYSPYAPLNADQHRTNDVREEPPGFGAMGLNLVGFYQRTQGGLALPIP